MKRFTTEIIKNKRNLTIEVWVDEKTAYVLEQLDEKNRHEYIVGEYEIKLKNRVESRHQISYEEYIEKGISFSQQSISLEDVLIAKNAQENLQKAIATLSLNQQWLIREIFENCRTQRDIAIELGVSPVAINNRLTRIFQKLKKILAIDR